MHNLFPYYSHLIPILMIPTHYFLDSVSLLIYPSHLASAFHSCFPLSSLLPLPYSLAFIFHSSLSLSSLLLFNRSVSLMFCTFLLLLCFSLSASSCSTQQHNSTAFALTSYRYTQKTPSSTQNIRFFLLQRVTKQKNNPFFNICNVRYRYRHFSKKVINVRSVMTNPPFDLLITHSHLIIVLSSQSSHSTLFILTFTISQVSEVDFPLPHLFHNTRLLSILSHYTVKANNTCKGIQTW
jgi:hypothetical protein